ncbi:MAG: hypothetical protein WD226_02235 [Planctomycetota bacterium]
MIVIAILVVAVSMFSQIVTSTAQMRSVSRERSLAAEAARNVLERMRNEPLSDVFDLFNASPEDDPDGLGTAPGHRFPVRGLRPLESVDDGSVGEIVMPALWVALERKTKSSAGTADGLWTLREDSLDESLDMPRDLNGDNMIDALDHRYDALSIPVLVRIAWQGRYGARSLEMRTVLTDFDLGDTR